MTEKTKELLRSRQQAYKQVFHGEGDEPSIPGEIVLGDLAKFCHAHESPFHKGERATLIMIGRQEVFSRIKHQLNMTDSQLWRFYVGVET